MIVEFIYGVKVNLAKSSLYEIHMDEVSIANFARVIGSSVARWLIMYLGMPLSGNSRSRYFWDFVVEKVSKKLAP